MQHNSGTVIWDLQHRQDSDKEQGNQLRGYCISLSKRWWFEPALWPKEWRDWWIALKYIFETGLMRHWWGTVCWDGGRIGEEEEGVKITPKLLDFFLMFIYFERETDRQTESTSGGGAEREGDTESLSCQNRAWCGARTHEPGDHDLIWSQMLNRLSHPGAP